MSDVVAWIGVGICGAAGALARYRVTAEIAARRPSPFPIATLFVNVSGCFGLGVLTGANVAASTLLVFGTGLLGAFTTFSTWMVEAHRLGANQQWRRMWVYLIGSMLLGIGATAVGWLMGEAVH